MSFPEWPKRPKYKSVWQSTKHTVLTFAVVHLLVTLYGAIFTHDWQELNIFNLIGLGQEHERLGSGERAFMYSYLLAGIIALIYLVLIERERKDNDTES